MTWPDWADTHVREVRRELQAIGCPLPEIRPDTSSAVLVWCVPTKGLVADVIRESATRLRLSASVPWYMIDEIEVRQ